VGAQPAHGPGKLGAVAHDGERGQRVHQRQRHAPVLGRRAVRVQVAQLACAPRVPLPSALAGGGGAATRRALPGRARGSRARLAWRALLRVALPSLLN